MKRLLIALVAFFAIITVASASPYKLDEAAVDSAIESAVAVSPVSLLSDRQEPCRSYSPDILPRWIWNPSSLHGYPSLDVGYLHVHIRRNIRRCSFRGLHCRDNSRCRG